MPSPFPGMDPYLEGADWPDFHATFLVCLRNALNQALPANYKARIDERLNLIEAGSQPKLIEPDLAIARHSESGPPPNAKSTTATLEPITIPLLRYVQVRERRIEIIHRENETLIAAIELLSPWNKSPGAGSAEYQAKRLQIIRQPVHLIEIDLLLAGSRIVLSRTLPTGDYYVFISRSDQRPNCDVYAWSLQDTLPNIPIPLHAPDTDVSVSLGKVFAQAFEMGEYDRDPEFRAVMPGTIREPLKNWVAAVAKSANPA